MKTFLIGAALTTCLVGHALATQQPNPDSADSRVRNVNYDPANVVELWSTPGAVMVIQFADDEMVGDLAASDSHSLKAEPRANYLFFKFGGCLIPEPVIVLTKLPSGKLRRYALQVETHPQICSNSTSPPIVQASAKADPPPVAAQNLKHISADALGPDADVDFATLFFLVGTGLLGAFAHPFWQWWLYALWYSNDPVVRAWLEVSGVPAAVLPLVGGGIILYRRRRIRGWTLRRNPPAGHPVAQPIRCTTDNHGHARWALMQEARALWPGANPSFGGIVVGEAYDPRQDRASFSPGNPATWGQGGRAPLLIDPCVDGSTHSLVIAGSGSFKTTSAVSTLLTWTARWWCSILRPSSGRCSMRRGSGCSTGFSS